MRLRIAPGSLWLAYSLTNPRAVERLLPASLSLSSARVLADDVAAVPSPKLFFNVYHVDAGLAMRGMRAEVLTLAQHRDTGQARLVILDCLTDTLQWDPAHGVRRANARFFRPSGARAVHYASGLSNGRDRLVLRALRGRTRPLDPRFAIEANHECYFQNVDIPYPMTFDPTNVLARVRELHPRDLTNTLWRDVRSDRPSHVFHHEQAMFFDVDVASFGRA